MRLSTTLLTSYRRLACPFFSHLLLINKTFFMVLALLAVVAVNVEGATYYSRATGNWNANTTWSLTSGGVAVGSGIYPGAGDNVVIENHTVTLNINQGYCNNFTLKSGSFIVNNTRHLNRALYISGSYSQSNGTLDFNNYSNNWNIIRTNTSTIYISGNFSNTAGTGSITTSGNGVPNGGFVFNGTGTKTFNMPTAGAAIWTTYTINSGSYIQLLSNFDLKGDPSNTFYASVTVNGTLDVGTYTISDNASNNSGGSVFTLNSGATLITANVGGVDGTFPSAYTTTSFDPAANYIFNGTQAQVTGASFTGANNLTINNTSGVVTASGAVNVSGALSIISGGTLNMGTNQLLGALATVTNNGTIQTQNTTTTPIPTGKTWGGTVEFNGTSNQTIPTSTFNNVIVSNSVTATATLSGIVTANLFSVTNTSTSAISGGSATAYVKGPLSWTLPVNLVSGSTYNFPVGNTTYLPFSLVNPTTTGTATAQVQAFTANSGGTADGSTLASISTTEYWQLTTTGNFTNSSVSLTRPLAIISPLNTIGGSTSAAGTYSDLGGTAGTYGVTNSMHIGTDRFFVLATIHIIPVVYVRVGGNNANDGSSWSKAKATIQNAVETSYAMTAKPPVYVAAGDYYRDITTGDYAPYTSGNWKGWANTFVMRNGVNVYGAFPEFGTANNTNAAGIPADTTMRMPLSTLPLYKTTLHAGPSPGGTQEYRVLGPVYSVTPIGGSTGFTTPTKWDGFDLTGANIITSGGGDDVCGAGAFTVPNSTLSNCMIENNTVGSSSNDGAAVEMNGGTLLSCIVHDNTGTGTSSAGTINIRSGGSNVINCLIYHNYMYLFGGSMSINLYTSPTTPCYIINNTMSQNKIHNATYGAEIHIYSGADAYYFYNNAVWDGTAIYTCVSGVTSTHESYNAWPSGYGGTLGTGSFVLSSVNMTETNSPYFVKPDTTLTADYRLQSTLSALYIKRGLSSVTGAPAFPTTDIRGVFRNTPPEIGCYELASRLYYVNNATGKDTTGYGFNWSNPYKTVQFAITAPQYSPYDFPQVWVAKGTYPASTPPYLLQNNLSMYGGFAGNQATEFPTTSAMVTSIRNSRNLKLNQTILAGNGSSVISATGTPTVIDGFTITGATEGSSVFAASLSGAGDTIENCKIINNATSALQLATGSNAYNVLVADNTGDGVNMAGTANLVNATIANNGGYGISSSSTSPTVTNSILWGNTLGNITGTTPTITYSAGSSNYGTNTWPSGNNNIDLLHRSPNFKNPNNNYKPNRNYELLLISPCLGNGSASANPLAIDANGKPRKFGTTIDMGAFEKWDGVTVNGSTVSNVRIGTTYTPATLAAAAKDSLEICVTAGTNFAMGNATIKTHWLELMQDTIGPSQLTNGTITADSVLYVRRFSKTLNNNGTSTTKGVWSFFGVPFNTAPLSTLDGAVDENTVRIEGYSENARAVNGVGYAWYGGRLGTSSTMTAGTGYALSFNNKVPQTDIGQTVIFSSPGTASPVIFDETGTPTQNVTLTETPSGNPTPYWYDCGWNLIANPLPQPAVLTQMWTSSSSAYYGAAYFYKQYTDNYNVVPASAIIAASATYTLAPNAAFFVQTDYDGVPATFQSTSSSNPVLQSMAYVRPSSSNAAAAPVTPATFQFHVTGAGDYCNTYVIFDPRAHAVMEPMEDNPTMVGVSAQPALQLSTTANGSTTELAINRLPFNDSTKEVPMQLYAPTAGSYTITMPQSDTIANTVLLQDASGNLHNLTTGGYTFTTTADGVTNNYTLIFGSTSTGTQIVKGITILQDHRNVTITADSTLTQVALYGIGGQMYYMQNPNATQLTLQLPSTPGVYLLKIITPQGVITKKMISRE